MIDNSRNFDIRFYAFGNKDVPVNIMDAHIVSHNQTKVQCKGDTVEDAIENMCAKNCHQYCNPVAGLYCQFSIFVIYSSIVVSRTYTCCIAVKYWDCHLV